MLKQQLNLKLQQRLSPMQIQVIKMLEFPALELEERVRQELVENPALEIGQEEREWDEVEANADELQQEKDDLLNLAWESDDEDFIPYKQQSQNTFDDEGKYFREITSNDSFIDMLKHQLDEVNVSKNIREIAEYVLGNIDSDGYLRRENQQMIDDILISLGKEVSDEDVEQAIQIIQSLEPIGIGSRNLKECLKIQLLSLEKTKVVHLAIEVIDKCFDMLARNAYDSIVKKLGVEIVDLKSALYIIKHLNPKPGNMYSEAAETLTQTIAPDFKVENIEGKLVVELITSNIPKLRVSEEYNNMLKDYVGNERNQTRQTKDAIQFARQKIDAARWFIDAIKQRNNTLFLTMKAIVDIQSDFFFSGDNCKLKPMRLKDVAEKVGLDVSTISRVSSSKYVDTEWGIISLKYFFTESMQTVKGEEVSNKEIKQIIREIIDKEDKHKPMTDDEITVLLNDKGYIVARRTVAKYREQLFIPVSRMRKIKI